MRKWILGGSLALIVTILIITVYSNTFVSPKRLPATVDYNLHIRPILSDKCFACHGPDANKRKADLRLDIEEGIYAHLKDSPDLFAIVPGKVKDSELYHRIVNSDTTEIMPPPESKLSLTEYEIQLIEKWIGQGAEYRPHWAFIPPILAELPEVSKESWARNEVDYFILNKVEELGFSPNPEADKERLLKRLAFDLTGLPPIPDLQDQFLADDSPEAYEKIVDSLLASRHYGEKMAVHWLDVARYADSHGYQDDGLRTMWPWRDWVIHAFNENYSYEQFITWQLAGDLLPNPTKEMLLATGFNRNHKITQEGGVVDEEYRIEYVTDRTNTFGKAILGLTFECAKCHDHKYDPIAQKDYYSTFAFFNHVPEKGIFGTIDASFADPPNLAITDEDIQETLSFINKPDTAPVMVMIMQDSMGLRNTHILNRGNYDAPAEQVGFGLPKAIMPFDTTRFVQNRLGLTQWLFDEKNPLTARVFVNRVWQDIMGTGIVKTAGDFGMQGDLPSHPKLLDWLSADFAQHDWDIKRLIKHIVMSATYRQSSEISDRKLQRDPENVYYSYFPRNRLGAESVRDHVLASSGLLHREVGGPSVKPYQPKGIWEAASSGRGSLQFYVQDHGNNLYRRGMYTFIKRTIPPPSMLMFDASSRDQCEVRRLQTSTPLQALIMLNDPHVLEAARVLAQNLLATESPVVEKIETAFRAIVCRKATRDELSLLTSYYEEEKSAFAASPETIDEFLGIGEFPTEEGPELNANWAALMQVIHTLYNMEEAITKS